jgi:hypothetical protein
MRITRSALGDSDLTLHLNTAETVGDRDVAVLASDLVGEDDLYSCRLKGVARVQLLNHSGEQDELRVEVAAPDEPFRRAFDMKASEVAPAPLISQVAFVRRGRVAVDDGHCVAISLHAHPEVLVAPI